MSAEQGTIKVCPQCGASFGCNPAACWCSSLPNIMPVATAAACYCPACLEALIAAQFSLANHQ